MSAWPPRQTVKSIMNGVQDVKKKNKRIRVAIMSVLPRPKEDEEYEQVRTEVNRKLHECVINESMKSFQDREDGGISFLDLDPTLLSVKGNQFCSDCVHLNEEGERAVSARVIKWTRVSTRVIQGMPAKRVSRCPSDRPAEREQ